MPPGSALRWHLLAGPQGWAHTVAREFKAVGLQRDPHVLKLLKKWLSPAVTDRHRGREAEGQREKYYSAGSKP